MDVLAFRKVLGGTHMLRRLLCSCFVTALLLAVIAPSSSSFGKDHLGSVLADDPPQTGNSFPTYLELRKIGLSGESAATNNFVLKRDAGTFTFKSGNLYFLSPVQGKVTGAVFIGE